MVRFFKSRRPGLGDLTWEEKNSGDYLYRRKDTKKLREFIEREQNSGKVVKKKK